MKKNKTILIILLITGLLLGIFFYNSYKNIQNKEKEIEKRKKQEELLNKEIEEKLEDFELTPLIKKEENKDEVIDENSGKKTTQKKEENKHEVIDENSGKKTTQQILKQEALDILTFSNIKQCDDLIYLKEKCRNNFLYSLALNNNNLNYCNQLKNKNELESCKDEINYNKLNCNDIKNNFLKEKCLINKKQLEQINQKGNILSTVKTDNDLIKCNGLQNYNDKERCLRNIILNTKNINLCGDLFKNNNEKERCLKNIGYELNRLIITEAYEKKDLNLCEKILDQNLKTQCKTMTF